MAPTAHGSESPDPPPSRPITHTWLLLSWLRQVCDACVGAHQNVAGMKRAFEEKLLRFRQMDPTQWGFGERVCWNQGQAINPNLMDAVNCLGSHRGNHVRTGIRTDMGQTSRLCKVSSTVCRSGHTMSRRHSWHERAKPGHPNRFM